MKRILMSILLYLSVSASAEESKSISTGHLLTPTTHTLAKGNCTVGFVILGCGVNDKLMIGTSPMLLGRYNMTSLLLRYSFSPEKSERWSTDLRYYKTVEIGNGLYDMEAFSSQLTRAHELNDIYTLNVALTYIFYFSETFPFSLRMFPQNGNRDQIALSTLHEVRVNERFGFQGELGVLGLNYNVPYMHYGASMYYKTVNWFFQLGLSNTFELGELGRFVTEGNSFLSQTAHPEIQLQYTF